MIEVAVAHPYLLVIYYLLFCFGFCMSACLAIVSTYAALYNSFFKLRIYHLPGLPWWLRR